MVISKTLQNAINKQINAELYSSYLYLSMAAYFDSQNLSGFSNWIRRQSEEETQHGMKFFDFLNQRGGRVILDKIEKPKIEWGSSLNVFEESYKHEIYVTKLINNLVDLATKEKDNATLTVLHWFVDEQVEEEASALEIVEKLKMVEDSKHGLLMLDAQLAKRGQQKE
ncbi:ferritin [Candidatus Woesearchaeota archaeon]|nr:ferritin [Candidatus Woesearchaeota archaeon]